MVRVNLIPPKFLSDQHLVAEYYEIAMLAGYVARFPSLKDVPSHFRLGEGHMKFFKDKILYLARRHAMIREEMAKRGFKSTIALRTEDFDSRHLNDWSPGREDLDLVRERLVEKIMLKKDCFYRYYGRGMSRDEMIRIIESSRDLG